MPYTDLLGAIEQITAFVELTPNHAAALADRASARAILADERMFFGMESAPLAPVLAVLDPHEVTRLASVDFHAAARLDPSIEHDAAYAHVRRVGYFHRVMRASPGTARGRVQDASGRGLAGYRVCDRWCMTGGGASTSHWQLPPPEPPRDVLTDIDGSFELVVDVVPRRFWAEASKKSVERVAIGAWSPDGGQAGVACWSPENAGAPVVITASPTCVLTASVTCRGRPLEPVTAEVRFASPAPSTSFAWALGPALRLHLPPGRYELRSSIPGRRFPDRPVEIQPGAGQIDLGAILLGSE